MTGAAADGPPAAGRRLLSILLAPLCAACRRPLASPSLGIVCDDCWEAVRPIAPPFCAVCGDPLLSWRTSSERCADCRLKRPHISAGRTVGDLRRAAAIDPAGVQVRPASIARAAARPADAAAWRGGARRCRLRRAGASALAPALAARASIRRSTWPASSDCPSAARCGAAGTRARRPTCPQTPAFATSATHSSLHAGCADLRPSHRAGGRRQHDRGDAGGVRAGADGGGGGGGADAYGSPSLDATACRTSALTSVLRAIAAEQHPAAHPPPAPGSWRGRGSGDRGRVRSDRGRPRLRCAATSGGMSSRIVRSAAGRKRWMSASHRGSSPCASP